MDTYARYLSVAKEIPCQEIGKSLFGREIYAFFVGNPTVRPVIMQSAIHAREWVTAEVCLELLSFARKMEVKGAYWFLPITNPDGVLLAIRGIQTAPASYRNRLLKINGSKDFSLWKANGRGVDLNVNFSARHGEGRQNVFAPAPENFVGKFPESEPCTKALVRFTRAVNPCLTISFHTKGQEIYYDFPSEKDVFSGDKTLGEQILAPLNYPFKTAPFSVGGYKDWCIQTLQIPAYTVELFSDALSHPVQKTALTGFTPKLRQILQNTENVLWSNGKSSCAPPY
ncbi:MAG: hypothetical protein E7363_06265 [Clostridiales bacterium]|nr:hypothetical protein [Clostridiales bacterium]